MDWTESKRVTGTHNELRVVRFRRGLLNEMEETKNGISRAY